ncbi:Na+/H+ antiporter, NhaC family [Thermotomaculum hydrothermale]|uniref:Na+/H+ antiporter, NhaC family n=1 Tax=Thermotomaculum hydrothermale TaxID=981385 RepID=A0A7R6PUY6_9BACT|nr:Na+/H+ antiporter, NhaC family [Thermotomaculum hydrothermale]
MPVFSQDIGAVFHKNESYHFLKTSITKESLEKFQKQGIVEIDSEDIVFKKTGVFEGRFFDKKIKKVRVINGYLSIIPPLLAIAFALIFKETIISLLLGIISGMFIINGFNLFYAVRDTLSEEIVSVIATKDHVSIIIFTVLLGGMVGIIQAGGGTEAVVQYFSSKIKSRKGAMLYSWLTGIAIFFDDYSNTLIVGKVMQPITDAYGVSREKLSYIVDSTAAPVTAIAVISTWIGFEISLLNNLFHQYGIKGLDGYTAFIYSIPYLFYPILTLVFVFFIATTGKDFGPMRKFEIEAVRKLCQLKGEKREDKGSLALGLIPVLVVIIVTFLGIYFSGKGEEANTIREIFANSDSFASLIWGSSAGCFVASIIALKKLKVSQIIEGWLEGLKSMVLAVVILALAWSLGDICGILKTGDYVVSLFPENFPMFLHPMLAFLVSAIISFATGTSWGTMAIGYPLLIPIVLNTPYLFASIAAILSGAVFGDHCSPISDTTIMSSMSSGCNHINHVRTQLPYAITVALISMFFCYGLLFLHLPPFVDISIGIFIIALIFKYIAKPVEDCYENKGN